MSKVKEIGVRFKSLIQKGMQDPFTLHSGLEMPVDLDAVLNHGRGGRQKAFEPTNFGVNWWAVGSIGLAILLWYNSEPVQNDLRDKGLINDQAPISRQVLPSNKQNLFIFPTSTATPVPTMLPTRTQLPTRTPEPEATKKSTRINEPDLFKRLFNVPPLCLIVPGGIGVLIYILGSLEKKVKK